MARVTKKITTKKPTKKKAGRPKVVKKKRAGWPKGKKRGKRRGRPRKKVTRMTAGNSILLPSNINTDLAFWSDMIVFLNKNKGKSFIIQMDGKNFTLHAS